MERKQPSFFQRRFYLLIDFWNFLRMRKKWWLLPLLVMMLFVGMLVVFAETSALSPFIYALF